MSAAGLPRCRSAALAALIAGLGRVCVAGPAGSSGDDDFCAGGPPRSDGCGAGEGESEESGLLQFRAQHGGIVAAPSQPAPTADSLLVYCPGNPSVPCKGNQCCPGYSATGNRTFPCPSADVNFAGCELKPPVTPAWFRSSGVAYDVGAAKAMAEVARASYCGADSNLANWTCRACKKDTPGFDIAPNSIRYISLPDAFESSAIFVFVAKAEVDAPLMVNSSVDCIISVRGTSNDANKLRDAEFIFSSFDDGGTGSCPGCKVEDGFYAVWKAAKEPILSALKDLKCEPNGPSGDLYITGHSLGGSVGFIGMFVLQDMGFNVQRSFLFEAALPGNANFAQSFQRRFGRTNAAWRVTHARDPVVHLPPWWVGYSTAATEVYYPPGSDADGFKVCNGLWDRACSYQWNLATTLLYVGDHCTTPLLPSRDICNPPERVCMPQTGVKSTVPHQVVTMPRPDC